jgi:hypothetical protein
VHVLREKNKCIVPLSLFPLRMVLYLPETLNTFSTEKVILSIEKSEKYLFIMSVADVVH